MKAPLAYYAILAVFCAVTLTLGFARQLIS